MSILKVTGTGIRIFSTPPTPTTTPWTRNPSWPACEAASGDNKVVGLYAVWPGDGVGTGGNFFAVTNAGDYAIDYGDGTSNTYTSGTTAYYEYDYNAVALDGTDAPVTFTAATNTVNRTAHGYSNGDLVSFYNIATTTGIDEGQKYYVTNATADTFQLTRKSYNAVGIASQEPTPTGVSFKPDGTKMYVIGSIGDDINEYSLEAAWDLSTASYVRAFSISAQDTAPSGLVFKPDGTKMYVVGDGGNGINEYDLSVAWDISTASYLQVLSVAGQETNPSGIYFKTDGTKMYVIGSAGDDVNEYSLGTAWDISTASYIQNFSVAAKDNSPQGISFKTDGTKMYVVGSTTDSVYEYDLSVAWDISTASYLQDISILASAPTGLYFKDDGLQMYVIGSTADTVRGYTLSTAWDITSATLQLDTTTIDFTNDGSATLLPYKIATVTITPQAGSDLTSLNFYVKHNQASLISGYSTGWLDIAIALPSCTSIAVGSTGTNVRHGYLEQVQINQLGTVTSFSSLFANCISLRAVEIADTITTVNNTTNMFTNCYSLTTAPLFNTASVINMSTMFSNCYSLTTVPLFDTAAVTSMSSLFSSCYSLTTVPLFNTASVTSMNSMFYFCYSLTTVPLFTTASVTAMSSMFYFCTSLETVPLFNTVSVINMSTMFSNCYSLTTVPSFNTASVTDMSGMFSACHSLTAAPLFNTAAVTNISSMFSQCYSLTTVPLFNTSSVTNITGMFQLCYSLTTVPLFNTSSATTMSSLFSSCNSLASVPALDTTATTSSSSYSGMFTSCPSLARIQTAPKFTFSVASCKLSAAALNEIYTNLPTVTGQTITVTGNYGTAGDDPTIATAKGWTVTG